MEIPLTAVELTGTIDEQHRLTLDGSLPASGPMKVRVIVLYPPNGELDEKEWLHAAASNPAFADLANPAEDIYSLADGTPFNDEGNGE